MDFVFITDLHFRNSSNVRVGDLLLDLKSKLQFVVDYSNNNNATILIGGDVFDKPSVPDIVKNTLGPVFLQASSIPMSILGNHDQLYGNNEFQDKTSYQLWCSHNVLKSFDNQTIDLGECIITNELPVINRGKPQIVVYHGFLNQEDGHYTFHFQDIHSNVTDQVYILLGHDHCEYEPLAFTSNVKIFRPGSFNRQTRDEESMRQPKILHIRVKGGKLQYKMVEIATARPSSEIFKTKLTNVTKAQRHETYEDIISKIRNANATEMSLEQALQQISEPDVCTYALNLLKEHRLNAQHERNNL